ncbi:MAG: tRNA (adenosine(37)-N6)-threonylcarbamoyltransferase complex dimerization subunit type 1 TsaB [Anaerolineales bacterium]|jgi:tRNA threonylcarbamoyladenosine biosynthesis protein TsaB|nr:tRNA (adenosine(37)-N6)-threonylcarbamoyltransferase complex dimerization subunit type 1 TsaB [Anaerolineales bacterium]
MLLALDTSTSQIGLALYDGARVLAEHLWVSKARHTVELAPAVAQMLQQTGTDICQVAAIGVALGPGSFTALRVGLAFGKGLALSRALPLIGIPTLDILAAQVTVDLSRPLACVLAAGRGRLALGWYHASENGWQAEGKASVTTAETVAAEVTSPALLTGELTAAERQILSKNEKIWLASPADATRRPGILAELAFQRWQAGQSDRAASLAPIYLHIGEVIPG